MPVFDDCSITCFMVFMPDPWGSLVRMNGAQLTMSLTERTSPSSNAIISDIGFITEPGSKGSTARLSASPYVPSSMRSMLEIALISPVFTSMRMAVPHSALASVQILRSSSSSMS